MLKKCSLLIIGLLISLQSAAVTDGPPKTDVDISTIPSVTPEALPISKYGNPDSYVINGKRYTVLKDSKNYDKIGIASWYGTKFDNKKTSDGDTYNMLAMTAASKDLPLPTFVLVTNLDNNKQIIVKVNDRGPFHKGRIIDLSYAAAKKIGMTDKGTANVRVTAIDTSGIKQNISSLSDAMKIQAANNGLYYIQVAALSEKQQADYLKQQLETNQSLPVILNQIDGQYTIDLGPVSNPRLAQTLIAKYRSNGFDAKSITV